MQTPPLSLQTRLTLDLAPLSEGKSSPIWAVVLPQLRVQLQRRHWTAPKPGGSCPAPTPAWAPTVWVELPPSPPTMCGPRVLMWARQQCHAGADMQDRL